MKKTTISVVASLFAAATLQANDAALVVYSSPFETLEKDATTATEIFTKEDIKQSNASDIYQFLQEQSSVTIMPNSGNPFQQKIDMRGYGITDGYQNIVVTINGQKLNNIDMQPQLLSTIPLESIKQIEIIRGGGIVEYGDGANAGVINIITDGKYNNNLKIYTGNNGTSGTSLSLGLNNEKVIFNTLYNQMNTDGTRVLTNNIDTDQKSKKLGKLELKYFPNNRLELRAGVESSELKNKYASSLSESEFNSNPYQSSSSGYDSKNDVTKTTRNYGLTHTINKNGSILLDYVESDTKSENTWGTYYYTSIQKDIKYKYQENNYKFVFGNSIIEGERSRTSDTSNKDNSAYYVTFEYSPSADISLNAGYRNEKVDYKYQDNAQIITNNESLNGYEIGINKQLNSNENIFANFSKSFQAQDLDRLFVYNFGTSSYAFNGYIKPMEAKTYTLGYNKFTPNNKFKSSIFYSKLNNEIYLYTGTYTNTNIDKSHKKGLEIFDKYQVNKTLSLSLNYNYIIAKIDEEDEGNGAYNGKYLPGVSKHNIVVTMTKTNENSSYSISHTYKSSAYNSEDFTNDASQKQKAYQSTNLSYNYNIDKNAKFFAKIENIFDRKNGFWVKDDAIYPYNFERTYLLGLDVKF